MRTAGDPMVLASERLILAFPALYAIPRTGRSRKGCVQRRCKEPVMSVQGHAASKFATGRQFASSSGRGWTNMLVERWCHAVGELTPVLTRDTEIDVFLSGGTLVERQGDGLRQTTAGQRGSLWIVPAGMREDLVNVQRPAHDCLHIFLPAQPFADCVLQDLDIDPARAKLRAPQRAPA